MAAIGTNMVTAGDTSVIGTTPLHQLGTRAKDAAGNEFIYLLGVASTAVGDFVTYTDAFATARLVADAVGNVAVAMSACVALNYGWYQIFGKATGATDAVATNVAVYIDATTGRVDDSAVSGDFVYGVITRSTDASTNLATVELSYPFVTNTSII